MEGMNNVNPDGVVGDETRKKSSVHRPSFDDNYASRFISSKSNAYPL